MRLCPICGVHQAHILVLQSEIAGLKRQNRKLNQRLVRVLVYVNKVRTEAAEVLSQGSGVERGRWSYVKGADFVAGNVRRLIRGI